MGDELTTEERVWLDHCCATCFHWIGTGRQTRTCECDGERTSVDYGCANWSSSTDKETS